VAIFDLTGTELMRWNFDNAYPVKWSGPALNATGDAVAVETLELAHEGMRVGQTGG
jgi:phage tail-like protein